MHQYARQAELVGNSSTIKGSALRSPGGDDIPRFTIYTLDELPAAPSTAALGSQRNGGARVLTSKDTSIVASTATGARRLQFDAFGSYVECVYRSWWLWGGWDCKRIVAPINVYQSIWSQCGFRFWDWYWFRTINLPVGGTLRLADACPNAWSRTCSCITGWCGSGWWRENLCQSGAYGNPRCRSCYWDPPFAQGGVGTVVFPITTTWWGWTFQQMTCQPGSFTSFALPITSTCHGCGGWEWRLSGPCSMCNPPRMPLTIAPYPAIGNEWFWWSCAPGFRPSGAHTGYGGMARRCPASQNHGWGGAAFQEAWPFFWERSLQCECNPSSTGSHGCAVQSSNRDAWISGRPVQADPANPQSPYRGPTLDMRYRPFNPATWVTDSTLPEARDAMVVAVRFTVRVFFAPCGWVTYNFAQDFNDDLARRGGIAVFSNRLSPRFRSGCELPAQAFVQVRNSTGAPRIQSRAVPINVPKSGSDSTTLEFWADAMSAARQRMPDAAGFFDIPAPVTGDFTLAVRIQDENGMGIQDALIAQENANNPYRPQGVWNFHSERAVIGVEFEFVHRKCVPGQYQHGDTCFTCPARFYTDKPNRVLDYADKPDRKELLPVNGSLNSKSPCWACPIDTCQFCNPQDGIARTMTNFCYINNNCTQAFAMKPNAKCAWCSPRENNANWSPQPRGTTCDDENVCTFFDNCNGNGICAGQPDDCLRFPDDPTRNCEVCGRDRCNRRADYGGCQFAYEAVAAAARVQLVRGGAVFTANATGLVNSWFLPGAVRGANASAIQAALDAAAFLGIDSSQPFVYQLGGRRVCGCSIDGRCFPHGALNPNNTCLQCDVSRNATDWFPTPAKLCDDQDPCTYADTCSAGICRGTFLNCTTDAPCIQSSTCQGTDMCRIVYRPTSHMCLAARSPCLPPMYCNGFQGGCPPAITVLPRVSVGNLTLQVPASYADVNATAVGTALVASQVPASLLGGFADTSIRGYPTLDTARAFEVRPMGWNVSCGNVSYRIGLYEDVDNVVGCTPTAVTDPGGYGWSSWSTVATVRNAWQPIIPGSFDATLAHTGAALPALRDGAVLRARVEASSSDGSLSFACVRVVVDATAPAAGSVRNIHPLLLNDDGSDARFVNIPVLRFTWTDFSEANVTSTFNGLLRYVYGVGTSPLAADVLSWRPINLGAVSTATNTSGTFIDVLPLYTPLFVTVRGYNRAGWFGAASGSSVIIDPTGPINGTVFNGLATDDFGRPMQTIAIGPDDVAAGANLSAQWFGFFDPESGVQRFEVAFGTTPRGTSELAFTPVPGGANATSFSVPYSAWRSGLRYFATVRAFSVSGAFTDVVSPGLWLDVAPPQSVSARCDFAFVSCSGARIRYNYSEPESIVSSANVTVFTASATLLSDVRVRDSTVASSFILPSSPAYSDGVRATISVTLTNIVRLSSQRVNLSLVLDCSAPILPAALPSDLRPGTSTGSVRFHTGPYLSSAWQPCSDSVSGILYYEVAVTSTGALPDTSLPDLAGFRFNASSGGALATSILWRRMGQGLLLNASLADLRPVAGWTYYTHVRCTNGAGITSAAVSPGVVIDATAPNVSAVAIGTDVNSSIAFMANSSSITISWNAWDSESGIAVVSVAVGVVNASLTSAAGWTDAPWGSRLLTIAVALSHNVRYVASVRVINNAGLQTIRTSAPVLVDLTPPTTIPGLVRDGLGLVQTSYASDVGFVTANWTGACSDPESGVGDYVVCTGSAPGLCDVMPASIVSPANTTTLRSAVSTSDIDLSSRVCTLDRSAHSRLLVERAPPPTLLTTASSAKGQHHRQLQVTTVTLTSWTLTSPCGGNGIRVDNPGSISGLIGSSRCAVGSYAWCGETSTISLPNPPPTVVTAWDYITFAGQPHDAYEMQVEALDANSAQLSTISTSRTVATAQSVSLTLSNIPSTARFIRFTHRTKDVEFWAGNFAAYMCGAKVEYIAPSASPSATSSTTSTASRTRTATSTSSSTSSATSTSSSTSTTTATPSSVAVPLGPAWLTFAGVRDRCVNGTFPALGPLGGVSMLYNVCLFRTVTISNATSSVVLGRFNSWTINNTVGGVSDFVVMSFRNGAPACGMERRVDVSFACSMTNDTRIVAAPTSNGTCERVFLTVALPEVCANSPRARSAPATITGPAWTTTAPFVARCVSGQFRMPSSAAPGNNATLTVCPYANVTMLAPSPVRPNDPPTSLLLGYFDSWLTVASGDFTVFRYMYFSGGIDGCGVGSRSVFVDFVCAGPGVVSASFASQPTENPVCVNYFITLAVPEACGANFAAPPARRPSLTSSVSAFPSLSASVTASATASPASSASATPSVSSNPDALPRVVPAPFYGPSSLAPLSGTCMTLNMSGVAPGIRSWMWSTNGTVAAAGVQRVLVTDTLAIASITLCPFRNVTAVAAPAASFMSWSTYTSMNLGMWDAWTTLTAGGITTYDQWQFRSGAVCLSSSSVHPLDGRYMLRSTLSCTTGSAPVVLGASESACAVQISLAHPAICAFATCPITPTSQHFTTVVCRNRAGLATSPMTSSGVLKDAYPPVIGSVRYGGPGACFDTTNGGVLPNASVAASPVNASATSVNLTAAGFTSGQLAEARLRPSSTFYFSTRPLTVSVCGFFTVAAPLQGFTVSLGSSRGANNILSSFAFMSPLIALPQVNLTDGSSYFASVTAVSSTGLAVTVPASAPAIFDSSPPSIASVLLLASGTSGTSASVWHSGSMLRLCAVNVREPHSPITSATLTLGAAPTASQFTYSSATVPLQPIPLPDIAILGVVPANTTVCTLVSGLDMSPGLLHVGTVTIVNAAGLMTTSSFAFTPVAAPPDAFAVWAGFPNSSLPLRTSGGPMPALISLNGTSIDLPIFFTLSRDVATGIAAYFAAVGSAPGSTDVLGWTSLGSGAAVAATVQSLQGLDGRAMRVAAATVRMTPAPSSDVRMWVSVLAVNAIGLSGWLAGLPNAGSVAITPRPFVWDRSPPIFTLPSFPILPAPVVVASGFIGTQSAAGLDPTSGALWVNSLGAGGITNATAITALWATPSDPVSDLALLEVSVHRVALGSPDIIQSTVLNWTRLADPTVSSVRLSLRSGVLTPYLFNACIPVRPNTDNIGGQLLVDPSLPGSGRNTSSVGACCALCMSFPQCAAYVYAPTLAVRTCTLYSSVGAVLPSAFGRTTGVLTDARAAFQVRVRATNNVGTASVISSLPLLVDTTPPTPPPVIAVFDTAGCISDSADIAGLHRTMLGLAPINASAADGAVSICVGFLPGSDVQTTVQSYAIAIGLDPGGSQVLPFSSLDPTLLRSIIAPSGSPVYRMSSPAFVTQHLTSLYVTLRAYDTAGNFADTGIGPIVALTQPPSTQGFSAWASSTRLTVRALSGRSRAVPLSWTGPGGDSARSTWFGAVSPFPPTPSGLAGFEVALSTTPNTSGIVSSAGTWLAVGQRQVANITSASILDTCANTVSGVTPVPAGSVRTAGAPTGLAVAVISECCSACNADASCVAYSFVSGISPAVNCWLYASVLMLQSQANSTLGYIGGPLTQSALDTNATTVCPRVTVRPGLTLAPGGGSRTPSYPNGTLAGDADACCALCTSDVSCVAYMLSVVGPVNGSDCWPLASVTALQSNVNFSIAFRSAAATQPVYGVVSALSNVGLRAVVATQPITFLLAAPIPGVAVLPGWVGGSPSITCEWSAFVDVFGPLTFTAGLAGASNMSAALALTASAPLNIAARRDFGTATSGSFQVDSSALSAFQTATCIVSACNAGGMCTSRLSAPARIDTVTASPGAVVLFAVIAANASTGAPGTSRPSMPSNASIASGSIHVRAAAVSVNSSLFIAWNNATCGASGLAGHSLCVGPTPTACDVSALSALPASQTSAAVVVASPLASGTRLFTSVTGMCGSGAVVVARAPVATIVDSTGPEAPGRMVVSLQAVVLSTAADTLSGNSSTNSSQLNVTGAPDDVGSVLAAVATPTPVPTKSVSYLASSSAPLFCAWTPASDAETGSLGLQYTVAYSYSATGSPAFAATVIGTVTSYVFNASASLATNGSMTEFVEGTVYCVITATNAAGLSSTFVTDGMAADWNEPVTSSAVARAGRDPTRHAAVSSEGCSSLTVTWSDIYDVGTGVRLFEACITTNPSWATCDVAGWLPASSADRHTFDSLQLAEGTPFYACVRAWDHTNRVSSKVCTPSFQVDCMAPQLRSSTALDLLWEAVQQAVSEVRSGWPFAHLFLPQQTSSLVDSVLRPLPLTDPVVRALVNTTLPATLSDDFTGASDASALLAAAVNTSTTFFAAPRMTVGSPFTTAASTADRLQCKLSTRPSEVFVVAISGNDTVALASAAPAALVPVSLAQNVSGMVAVVCAAGMYRDPVLDACLPCADGFYKATTGDNGCMRCGVNTLSWARADAAVITDVSQQQVRGRMAGRTMCECWDTERQVFDPTQNACVCAPGFVRNSSVVPPRLFVSDPALRARLPRACTPVDTSDGVSYKSVPGDSSALVRTCPPNSTPSPDLASCVCTLGGQTFDASTGTCTCAADYFLSEVTLPDGVITACIPCPPGNTKPSLGTAASLCVPCPWGTKGNSSGIGCVIDGDIIGNETGSAGAVLMPDASSAACAPGYAVEASYRSQRRGFSVNVLDESSNVLTAQLCLPVLPSMLTTSSGVPQTGGVAMLPGASVALNASIANSTGMRFSPILSITEIASMLPADAAFMTVVNASCLTAAASLRVRCVACDAASFQPQYLPLRSTEQITSTYIMNPTAGMCTTCPSLLRGSFFTSTDATLYLDWTGAFTDGNGTGIQLYEYAVGTVVGGSQIVPFTPVSANVTSVTIPADLITVVSGTPMFLTVVAVDGAGNRGRLQDVRPVLYDGTAPVMGLVVDGSIDDALGGGLEPPGATVTDSTTLPVFATGIVRTSDIGARAAEGDINMVEAAVARISAMTEAASRGDFDAAAAFASQPLSAFLPGGNTSSNVSTYTTWRDNPFFTSLTGITDVTFQADVTTYSMSWEPVQDSGSGIAALAFCVGSTPFSCDVVPMTATPAVRATVDSVTLTDLALPPGNTVYGTLFAVNGVGMVSMSVSNGMVADNRAPTVGIVYDVGSYFEAPRERVPGAVVGLPVPRDLDCDISGAGIGAVWVDFISPVGMDHFEWAVCSSPGVDDVLPFTNVGLRDSVYNASVNPPTDAFVFVCVRAVAMNGAVATGCSDGLRMLPPGTDADGSDDAPFGAARVSDGMFVCVAPQTTVRSATLQPDGKVRGLQALFPPTNSSLN